MAIFIVTDKWINADGEQPLGEEVEIPYDTPKEKVDADKLVSWGVIDRAPEKTESTKADKPASK